MKGGARRKTITSDLPPPPPPVQNEINDPGNDQIDYNKQNRKEEQQQQRPMNGEDGGSEYGDEEEEDYEEEDDQSGDVDVQGGAADVGENKGEEGKPKLAEGFYEIEAVRRKRIRKGEAQYLIKWRGWPESSNTWEPIENLMACIDVIDAFEESLRSGKHRSNWRRKRKNSVAQTPQSKKKQKQQSHQHSPGATYEIPSVKIKIIDEPLSAPSVHNSNFTNGTNNNIAGTSNNIMSDQSNDTGSLVGSPKIGEGKEKIELDPKRSQLKVPSSTNQENMTEFAIHIQEDRAASGISKVNRTEPIRASPRVGARRRKSFAVKRFKQDSNSSLKNDAHDAVQKTTDADDIVGQAEIENVGTVGNGLDSSNILDISGNVSVITKIVKPVNYSTSILNDTENVSVSFLVRRSDGEEVVVDNHYLKENNPILLINFYEQHLRYNSPE